MKDTLCEEEDVNNEEDNGEPKAAGHFSNPADEIELMSSNDHDTMFMNKYREDVNVATVANKYADAIILYERCMKKNQESKREEIRILIRMMNRHIQIKIMKVFLKQQSMMVTQR